MKHILALAMILVVTAAAAQDNAAQKQHILQVFGGTAANADSNLKVEQTGFPDLSFNAHYKTGTGGAPYYAWRYGNWNGDHAWEFEHIHHVLELTNNPPEIQHFEVSHGFNMFMLNRAWRSGGLIYRYGGGVVVTHAEGTIRNQDFSTGYTLDGVCGQFAAEKRWHLSDSWTASLEGKVTAGWARVPIADGHATVQNYALHGLIGIGYQW